MGWGKFADCDVRWNERQIALMNSERQTAQYRSRTGRLAKWRKLVETAQQELEMPVAVPDSIRSLDRIRE